MSTKPGNRQYITFFSFLFPVTNEVYLVMKNLLPTNTMLLNIFCTTVIDIYGIKYIYMYHYGSRRYSDERLCTFTAHWYNSVSVSGDECQSVNSEGSTAWPGYWYYSCTSSTVLAILRRALLSVDSLQGISSKARL